MVDAEGKGETVMLSRYEYTARGELLAVFNHAGIQVRDFLYYPYHSGWKMGHRYADRPQMRCCVIGQLNPITATSTRRAASN